MHALHLLRHAKSDPDAAIEDFDRRLNRRGREAAHRIAEILPAALGAVDLVLCSPAIRTRETAEVALAGFHPQPSILYEDALYLAADRTLLRRLCRLAEETGAVLVIGHNPGLHELALVLARSDEPHYQALAGGKFPTLARASFTVGTPWARLSQSRHQLTAYATPKSLWG